MGKNKPRWSRLGIDSTGKWAIVHDKATTPYCERTSEQWPKRMNGRMNFVCMDCRISKKSNYNAICQLCGKPMLSLGLTGRAPKRDCSAAAWRKFVAFVKAGDFHPKNCR